MCRQRATSKLLQQLLDEHDLCLLTNALTTKEIFPGTVVTRATFRPEDRPVRRPFDAIYTPPFPGMVTKARYRPITLARSNGELSAELIAKVAGQLGEAIGISEFQSALETSGARTFDISLGDARRADIDTHAVEDHLRTVALTDRGRELYDEGQEFYLIRRTVIAAEVAISGGSEAASSLFVKLAGLLDGKASITRRGQAEIVMGSLAEAMVVGFSASRIIDHPAGGFTLQGLTKPRLLLDEEDDRLESASATTFGDGSGEPLAALDSASERSDGELGTEALGDDAGNDE